jgi:hypothetical protein
MASVPPETLAVTNGAAVMLPHYSGNEDIVFPPHSVFGIHSSNDQEVFQPECHPSIYRLRGHNCHYRSQTTPITASGPPVNSYHSEGRPFFDPSTRSASLPIAGWDQSSTSRDPKLAEIAGKLPGVNASVELLTSSQRRPRNHVAETSTITLAEAVKREAMVEEQKVMDEHMRKEEAEAEDNAKTWKRSRWMGFFFSRGAT